MRRTCKVMRVTWDGSFPVWCRIPNDATQQLRLNEATSFIDPANPNRIPQSSAIKKIPFENNLTKLFEIHQFRSIYSLFFSQIHPTLLDINPILFSRLSRSFMDLKHFQIWERTFFLFLTFSSFCYGFSIPYGEKRWCNWIVPLYRCGFNFFANSCYSQIG